MSFPHSETAWLWNEACRNLLRLWGPRGERMPTPLAGQIVGGARDGALITPPDNRPSSVFRAQENLAVSYIAESEYPKAEPISGVVTYRCEKWLPCADAQIVHRYVLSTVAGAMTS